MALVFKEGWMRARGETFPISPLEATDQHGAKTLVLDSRPGRGYAETASVLAAMQWWMEANFWDC